MLDMEIRTVDPYVTRLFDQIRGVDSLVDQASLLRAFEVTSARHIRESRRRIAYEMKVKRIRNIDIADMLGVDVRTVSRYIHEWCDTYRLPIPRYGIAEGEPVLVTDPRRTGGTAT